jgi:hypothetical protein
MSGYRGRGGRGRFQNSRVFQNPGRSGFNNQQAFGNAAQAAPNTAAFSQQTSLALLDQERAILQQKIALAELQSRGAGAGMLSRGSQTRGLPAGQVPNQQPMQVGKNGQLPSHSHVPKRQVPQGQGAMRVMNSPNLAPDLVGSRGVSGMPMALQSPMQGSYSGGNVTHHGMPGLAHVSETRQGQLQGAHVGPAQAVGLQAVPPRGTQCTAMSSSGAQQAQAAKAKATNRKLRVVQVQAQLGPAVYPKTFSRCRCDCWDP